MENKVKVLTIQWDVTGLDDQAIENLKQYVSDATMDIDLLNTSVREVDVEDN